MSASGKPSKQKPAAMPSRKKKKKAKHNSNKTVSLGAVPRNNLEAIRFLKKLAGFKRAQANGVLPNDIPFNWSEFFKGTQAPSIRLYTSRNVLQVTVSTNVTQTYSLTAAQFQDFSDLAAIFDEYRPIGGEFYFVPGSWPYFVTGATHQANLGTSIGVIDYDNATALASFNEGLEYDTKKWFNLSVASENAEKSITRWPVIFEKLPDQEWLDTATTSTAFATFKMFTDGSDINFTNSRVGSFAGWMDFQFRGAS